MTITANKSSTREINLAARLATTLAVVAAIFPPIIATAQLCGFQLRAAVPNWMEWTWLAIAYSGLFLVARYVSASTRTPDSSESTKSILGADLDRSIRRAQCYFGVMGVIALTIVTLIGCNIMAPARVSLPAALFLWLPMLSGLLLGEFKGFYRLRLAQVSVLI